MPAPHGTFPKIHPIWRSHPSLKIKSLQTSNKALQTWSRIKSKGANWCPKQRCKCILHHFALPHGLLQGNCEKARSEYIYCKANCILIELQKSWNPPEVPSSINLAASQGSTSPSFLGNKDTPRSTNDLQSHTLTTFTVMILGSQAVSSVADHNAWWQRGQKRLETEPHTEPLSQVSISCSGA